MFSFQACELRWPFLRGIRALSALFDKANTGIVSDVVVVPGHVAVLLHSSALLCVFDAVPSEHQISESEHRHLSSYLVKHPPKAPEELANEFKGILLSPHNSPVTSIWFEKSRRQHYLHLYACQQDGYLSCWVWLPHKWAWQQVGKRVLLPPTRDLSVIGRTEPIERIVTNVVSTKLGQKRKQLLVWCETYRSLLNKIAEEETPPSDDSDKKENETLALDNKTRLCWCEITAISADESAAPEKKPPINTPRLPPPPISLTLGRSTFADTIDETVERAYASREGVWFISQNYLYYWPFLTRTLIPKSLQPKEAEGISIQFFFTILIQIQFRIHSSSFITQYHSRTDFIGFNGTTLPLCLGRDQRQVVE